MTIPELEQQVNRAVAEMGGPIGKSLFARINAFAIFETRKVPSEERPSFSAGLPRDAYEVAHEYLSLGLRCAYAGQTEKSTDALLERAGELLEKVYLEAKPEAPERTRELHNAALAYYLSGHYARAYVIMKEVTHPPLSHSLALLRRMFLKDLQGIRQDALDILTDSSCSDSELQAALRKGELSGGEAVDHILLATLARALSLFVEYAWSGSPDLIVRSRDLIDTGIRLAIDQELFQWWWLMYGTGAMLNEYQQNALWTHLAPMLQEDQSGLVQAYIQASFRRRQPIIELWRSQIHTLPRINDSCLTSDDGVRHRSSYCLKMPTSSGKTRVAELAILRFLLDSINDSTRKCLYIAPYRSLAAEVEQSLGQCFRPMGYGVSEIYGGFDISPTEIEALTDTRVLIATPEKTDAFLRYNTELAAQIGLIIIDEGHIIDRGVRGLRYEFFLHRVIRRFAERGVRLLFISAVMPNTEQFTTWITGQDRASGLIESDWRASRQFIGTLKWNGVTGRVDYLYRGITPIRDPMFIPRYVSALPSDELRAAKAPRRVFPGSHRMNEIIALAGLEASKDGTTLIFSAQQRYVGNIAEAILEALELQQSLAQHRGVKPVLLEKRRDPESVRLFRSCLSLAEELTGTNSLVARALKAGFVIHHGGIPKALRVKIETLVRERVVNLVVATNTLAQGVNLPVKTILIHTLAREAGTPIPSADFWNICGRAGRAMVENEGMILLLVDDSPRNHKDPDSLDPESIASEPWKPTPDARAKRLLKKYVKTGQSHHLESSIGGFLKSVLSSWKESHPDADLSDLCEHLADGAVSWLPDKSLDLLDVLDAQLLALLQELDEAGDTPESLQRLFERSLLLLQAADAEGDEALTTQTALRLLGARIRHIRQITLGRPIGRFYRMGLALSSCLYVERNRAAIQESLESARKFLEWTPEKRCSFLTGICEKYVMQLSDLRPEDQAFPKCWSSVVYRWLLGETPEQIAQVPEVHEELETPMRVSSVIDDLCDYRLPWGFNALYSFWRSGSAEAEGEQETEALPMICSYFASMMRYGVNSPTATILLASGMTSRRAASTCAEHYLGVLESSSLLAWVGTLTDDTLAQWAADNLTRQTILEFAREFRARANKREPVAYRTDLRISSGPYLAPLQAGTPLLIRTLRPDRLLLYSPAIERLGELRIEDEMTFEQIESGDVTAMVQTDPVPTVDGGLALSVVLVSVGLATKL